MPWTVVAAIAGALGAAVPLQVRRWSYCHYCQSTTLGEPGRDTCPNCGAPLNDVDAMPREDKS